MQVTEGEGPCSGWCRQDCGHPSEVSLGLPARLLDSRSGHRSLGTGPPRLPMPVQWTACPAARGGGTVASSSRPAGDADCLIRAWTAEQVGPLYWPSFATRFLACGCILSTSRSWKDFSLPLQQQNRQLLGNIKTTQGAPSDAGAHVQPQVCACQEVPWTLRCHQMAVPHPRVLL